MFAHNNEKIDYFTIAYINALMVRRHLNVGSTIVVDQHTYDHACSMYTQEQLSQIENIVFDDSTYDKNSRIYRNAGQDTETLDFRNRNRSKAYDLSPYEETLLIDGDYLIQSDSLSHVWDSVHSVMINHRTQETNREQKAYDKFIGEFGIRMYWATVVYFKKDLEAKSFFECVKDVSDRYTYYNLLYCFPNNMYRNDWAFSIAVHKMSDYTDGVFPELPCPVLQKCFDRDDIVDVNQDSIVCLLQSVRNADKYSLTRVTDTDIHIMNKYSILKHKDKFLEIYSR